MPPLGMNLAIGRRGLINPAAWLPNNTNVFADFTKGYYWDGGVNPDAGVVDTHAQQIYAEDADGLWVPKAANVPCLTDAGLQTVPTRTNSVRNNSMEGAVVGVVGSGGAFPTNWARATAGLTEEILALGTDATTGFPYIDLRISGTTDNTFYEIRFEGPQVIACVNGDVDHNSFYGQMLAGSLANITSAPSIGTNYFNSTGGYLNNGTQSAQTGGLFNDTLKRFGRTGTATHVDTAYVRPIVGVGFSVGVAIDLTIRIIAPMLERGVTFPTAPILTTTAAVTVNGNQQVIDFPLATDGNEIITNGTFDTDLTGWVQIGGAGGSSVWVAGELEITGGGASFPGRRQVISGLTVGRKYRLTAKGRQGTTTNTLRAQVQTSVINYTTEETKSVEFVATDTSTNVDLMIANSAATGTAYFDNVTLMEMTGELSEGISGFIKVDVKNIGVNGDQCLTFNDGTGNERIILRNLNGNELYLQFYSGGVSQGVHQLANPWVAGLQTIVFAAGPGFVKGRLVGGNMDNAPVTTGIYPASVSKGNIGGPGITTSQNTYQVTKKLVLRFGPVDQAIFDEVYAQALAA